MSDRYWRDMAQRYPRDPFVQVLAERERCNHSPWAFAWAAAVWVPLLAAWLLP